MGFFTTCLGFSLFDFYVSVLGNGLSFFLHRYQHWKHDFLMEVISLLIIINLGARSLGEASNIMRLIIKLQELAILLSKNELRFLILPEQ